MLKVGLTGGIGAGKSKVLFWMEKEWGAGIIRTDKVAHQLMEPGEEGYIYVVKELGTSILESNGKIDRLALAKLIFHDTHARHMVDSITHPLVWGKVKEALSLAQKEKRYEIMVVESALFNQTARSFLDEIWYVYAEEEVRVKRLMENRGYDQRECWAMIKCQLTDQQFRKISSRVIANNGDWESTCKEIEEVYRAARSAAAAKLSAGE